MFLALHRTLSFCIPWLPYFQQCEQSNFYPPKILGFDRRIKINNYLLLDLVRSLHLPAQTIDSILFLSGGRLDECLLLLLVLCACADVV